MDVQDEDDTERLKGSICVTGTLKTKAVPVVGNVEDEDDTQSLEGQKNGRRGSQAVDAFLIRPELPYFLQHVVKLHCGPSSFCGRKNKHKMLHSP